MGVVRRLLWSLRRQLGLSPTQQLFRELRRKGVVPERLRAVELFGGSGRLHILDFARQVAALDIWEIEPGNAAALRRAFPAAEVRITDSYQEVGRAAKRYDLIVIDNPEGEHGGHYEHFDLFPAVLRLAADQAVLVFNVRPGPGPMPATAADRMDEAHLARRQAFYRSDHPEQIPVAEMVPVYRDLLLAAGFDLEWHVSRKRTRSRRVHYLALKVRRSGPT
jgi:hypothetical protein